MICLTTAAHERQSLMSILALLSVLLAAEAIVTPPRPCGTARLSPTFPPMGRPSQINPMSRVFPPLMVSSAPSSAPPAAAQLAAPLAALGFVARWTARVAFLLSILSTPFLNVHATALSIALPPPQLQPSAQVLAATQTMLVAVRAKLSAYLVAAKLAAAGAFPSGALPPLPPLPSLPAFQVSAATTQTLLALGAHFAGGFAIAAAGTSLVCMAFPTASPPLHAPEPAPPPEPSTLQTVPKAAPRRLLKMSVRGLDARVSPRRLLYAFPQALRVDALYHKSSGSRTIVVLTFDAQSPPSARSSTALGTRLNAVVRSPEACSEYTLKQWAREEDA
mmetsp:Transcript_26024/g.85153  ORF Transcript_26024/g.85153 Transcript_26024/m.85153 type:complete len:334 (-) Transcript_26024:542-1543(-)